jgi:hypothetical protein
MLSLSSNPCPLRARRFPAVPRVLAIVALLAGCSDEGSKSDARHYDRKVSALEASTQPDSQAADVLQPADLVRDKSAKPDVPPVDARPPDSAAASEGKQCQYDVDCDDKLACNTDKCSGGKCSHYMDPNYCVIAKQCMAAGTTNPSNPCERCDPSTSQSAWTAFTCVG